MLTIKVVAQLVNFQESKTDNGDVLKCLHMKTGPNNGRQIWLTPSNLFYEKFSEKDIGKRYDLVVTEEVNAKGNMKTRLQEYKELAPDEEKDVHEDVARDENGIPF
jgi:hypothetical protein